MNQLSTPIRNRKQRIISGEVPKWKVHVPLLIQETLSNPNMGALKIPYQILMSLFVELAEKTIRIGDIPVDDMMIRLAIYAQGDPRDRDHAKGTAISINESRVRDIHSDEKSEIVEKAIVMAHDDVAPDAALIGRGCAAAWSGMPFASRVAVAVDGLSRTTTNQDVASC